MRRPPRWRGPCVAVLLAALLSPVWISAAGAADRFVAGIDDLPLMTGLAPMAGQNVVFDAPSGRVVEAWAQGAVTREAVLSFYGSTLPQLGWTVAAPDLFHRDGETLRVEFPSGAAPGGAAAASGTLLIRFYLSPG
jgi:hypothetical protein